MPTVPRSIHGTLSIQQRTSGEPQGEVLVWSRVKLDDTVPDVFGSPLASLRIVVQDDELHFFSCKGQVTKGVSAKGDGGERRSPLPSNTLFSQAG